MHIIQRGLSFGSILLLLNKMYTIIILLHPQILFWSSKKHFHFYYLACLFLCCLTWIHYFMLHQFNVLCFESCTFFLFFSLHCISWRFWAHIVCNNPQILGRFFKGCISFTCTRAWAAEAGRNQCIFFVKIRLYFLELRRHALYSI